MFVSSNDITLHYITLPYNALAFIDAAVQARMHTQHEDVHVQLSTYAFVDLLFYLHASLSVCRCMYLCMTRIYIYIHVYAISAELSDSVPTSA